MKPMPRLPVPRLAATVVLFACILASAAGEQTANEIDGAAKEINPLGRTEESLLKVADNADYPSLIENPTTIAFGVESGRSHDPFVTITYADIHAVYPVPFEHLRDAIIDLDSHQDYVPRVTGSRAEKVQSDPPRWTQHVELSFRVLGFGADYSFRTDHRTRISNDDRFAHAFRMIDSQTETLVDSGGTWYLKRIHLDGIEHTYARYTAFAAFGRRIVGLRLALRNLGLRDVQSVMNAYYRQALSPTH